MIPGSLQKGKGNRVYLDNTEELHDRIQELEARNRSLEEALRASQASALPQTHPLPEAGPSQPTGPLHCSVTPFSDNIPGTLSTLSTNLEQDESRRVDAFGDFSAVFYQA